MSVSENAPANPQGSNFEYSSSNGDVIEEFDVDRIQQRPVAGRRDNSQQFSVIPFDGIRLEFGKN